MHVRWWWWWWWQNWPIGDIRASALHTLPRASWSARPATAATKVKTKSLLYKCCCDCKVLLLLLRLWWCAWSIDCCCCPLKGSLNGPFHHCCRCCRRRCRWGDRGEKGEARPLSLPYPLRQQSATDIATKRTAPKVTLIKNTQRTEKEKRIFVLLFVHFDFFQKNHFLFSARWSAAAVRHRSSLYSWSSHRWQQQQQHRLMAAVWRVFSILKYYFNTVALRLAPYNFTTLKKKKEKSPCKGRARV